MSEAKSDHFDGKKFFTPWPVEGQERGFVDVLKWKLAGSGTPWPKWVDVEPGPKPAVSVDGLRVTFVNHATALIQTGGINLVTDPVWSDQVGPFSFAGVKRHRVPGIRFEDLPKIDFVFVSHNHFDHLDIPTIKRLIDAFQPVFITGLGGAPKLRAAGAKTVHELDWWQEIVLNAQVQFTAVPAQHWSFRNGRDRNQVLWMGGVIQGPKGSVYFPGDTGFGPHFEMIHKRLGAVRVALLPIGAYLPRWFMKPQHMNPDDAVQAHLALGAETSIAIHYGTFQLSDEGRDQPVADLGVALKERGVSAERFRVLPEGEPAEF